MDPEYLEPPRTADGRTATEQTVALQPEVLGPCSTCTCPVLPQQHHWVGRDATGTVVAVVHETCTTGGSVTGSTAGKALIKSARTPGREDILTLSMKELT